MENLTNWEDFPLALTAKHISKILGLSMPLVYQLLNRANFPSIRISEKRFVVPKEQFRRWLEEESSNGR